MMEPYTDIYDGTMTDIYDGTMTERVWDPILPSSVMYKSSAVKII
jgi:hypothetical protein